MKRVKKVYFDAFFLVFELLNEGLGAEVCDATGASCIYCSRAQKIISIIATPEQFPA